MDHRTIALPEPKALARNYEMPVIHTHRAIRFSWKILEIVALHGADARISIVNANRNGVSEIMRNLMQTMI